MQKHWEGYLKALGETKTMAIPQSSMPAVAPYETSSSEYGKTGFMDLLVNKPQIQARYDAMAGSWEGVQASESAASSDLFKTESMPIAQKQLKPNNKK